MTAKIVRFAHWRDPDRYHGYTPPRRNESWDRERSIYLIRAAQFVKIGVAGDPSKRIEGLRSGCPFPIETLSVRTVPAVIAYQVERRVHRQFAEQRIHGEWFDGLEPEGAKAAIHAEIRRAKEAMGRWLRDGYLEWEPPPTKAAQQRAEWEWDEALGLISPEAQRALATWRETWAPKKA